MKSIFITTAMFCVFVCYGQATITATMISASTASITNGNRNIVGTVGEITVIGKAGNLYLGSGFYRSNAGGEASTGISNITNAITLNVYPNPFTDKLTIEPQADFVLFDMTGKQVYASTSKNDLSLLPTGNYVLQAGKTNIKVLKK